MKKFLSMLLALSVVFTFTFGSASSAFAAQTEAEKYSSAVTDAQGAMTKIVDQYSASLVYKQDGTLSTDTTYTKTAIDKAIADLKAEYNNKIVEKAADLFKDGVWSADDTTNLAKAYEDINEGTKVKTAVFTTNVDALNAYGLAEAAAKLEAAVNEITVGQYALSKQEDLKADITSYTAKVTAAKTKVAAKSAADTDIDTAVTDVEAFKAMFETKNNVKYTTYSTKYMTVAYMESELNAAKAKALETLADTATEFKTKEEARLTAIANDPSKSVAEINDATVKLNSLDANIAAVKTSFEAKINAVAIKDVKESAKAVLLQAAIDALNAINPALKLTTDGNSKAFYDELDAIASTDALVKYAENYAASLKTVYVEATGALKYNAATVDEALTKLVALIKAGDDSVNTYAKIKAWLENDANCAPATADAATLLAAKAQGIADITGESCTLETVTKTPVNTDYKASNWDKDNKKAVEAAQKEYTLKLKAATSLDDVKALVKAAKAAMNAYLTTAQVAAVTNDAKTQAAALEYISSASDYTGKSLAKYADGVAAKDAANTYADATKKAAVEKAVNVLVDAVLAGQKADYTAKEIKDILKANYGAALAEIDKMQGDAALKTAKETLEAAIKALNTNATLETKDAYIAVKGQYDEYKKLAGAQDPANLSLLKAYITKIVTLEKTAVTTAINKLPNNVTLADKEAVEAVRKAYDAYVADYEEYGTAFGYIDISSSITKLTNAEAAISSLVRTEVAKLIAALPATITAKDKEAVEAARKAYDALSESDKAIFDGQSAALVTKLTDAEATIKETTKYTDKDAKADLLDMNRKVTIWRTSKKSIRVTAVGSVSNIKENGYTVKYTFYKKAPGAKAFKAVKTTTSNKFVYKNLKKGTNKFQVKVSVYNAEGKLVASKTTFYKAVKVK
ncbi:MAG: hypothetical protein Q4E84_07360 [Clostridia bacterium]|nr:hypothetical protein [Clostridia bacterium]